ncbi:hypothetical protein [Nocardiopsis dassonvillei]|uniref:hypothetical protein n=1 Tax=Nocardiopsis dassonvillei TaxID=2014 RepID=UPI00364175DF
MPDREPRAALAITEADLDHLAAHRDLARLPVQTVLTAAWPRIVALVVDRAATLAEQLADDARAAGEHPWSNAAARGHRIAAEWLRWLADELDEDGADTPAASPGSQEDHAAIRARIAEALYVEPDMPSPTLEHVRRMEAAHRAYAVMTVVAPELAARSRRIAELEERLAATTRPDRAVDRLAADADPGPCPWTRTYLDGVEYGCDRPAGHDGQHRVGDARPTAGSGR